MMKNPVQTKFSLPKFKRGNLVEMVFNTLRDEILSGKFEQGEKLTSQETFCKELGVSRTVVREAWNRLSSVGLVKTLHGHGSFVNHPDASNMMEAIYKSAINYHKRIIKAIVEKDSDLAEAEIKAHLMDVIKTLREKLNLNVRFSNWTKGGDKQFRLKRKVEYINEQKNDRVPPRRYLRWKISKLGME